MKPVLLDSNTLLPWLVAAAEPHRLGQGRVSEFDIDDISRLAEHLDPHDHHITLPNILTEVSNLIDHDRRKPGDRLIEVFTTFCLRAAEMYVPSAEVASTPQFSRIGLTDAAVLRLKREGVTVFSTDYRLGGYLTELGITVINLMHFKTPGRRS